MERRFIKSATLEPIVRKEEGPRPDIIYFVLVTGSGWCIPGTNPWSTTLHIAIDPERSMYNDIITCSEWQVEQRVIDSVDLPDDYLLNLVRLSRDKEFLAITDDMIYRCDVCDGGSDTIEYYINGIHRSLWCYFMDVIDGQPLQLNPEKEGDSPIEFELGIEGTSEFTNPPVSLYYHIREDDYRAMSFADELLWHLDPSDPKGNRYCFMKGMSTDQNEFVWFLQYIRDNTTFGELVEKRYICSLDGWRYWINDSDLSRCSVIYREKEPESAII